MESTVQLRQGDELESEEFVYREMSPLAVASLICGVLAVISVMSAPDLGYVGSAAMPAVGIVCGLLALRSIRKYDLTGMGKAWAGMSLSALAMVGGWAFITYVMIVEVPPGAQRISYQQLQAPPGGGDIPPSARALDGKRVFVKGYVYPGREMTGIKQFVLCRDNGTCCFGGQPKLNDMIQVTLKEPLTLDYNTHMRHVAGTFRVEPAEAIEGLGGVLYHLEADYLK